MNAKSNAQSGGGWIAPAVGAATGLLGMIGQRKREKRQMENQKTLMDWQYRNQRALNEQGHELQMQMWKDTNYPAQMAMMKEAGLNPALMYGQGGGGGTTAGSQGGGSAASGNAPSMMPMELGAMINATKTAAEISLLKSQAKKNEAEATKISGVDTELGKTQILDLTQGIENKKQQQELQRAQTRLTDWNADVVRWTFNDAVESAKWIAKKTKEEYRKTAAEANVAQETQDQQIKLINLDVIQGLLNNSLTKQNITLTETKTRELSDLIEQRWEAVRQRDQQLFNEDDVRAVNERLGEGYLDLGWFNSIASVLSAGLVGGKEAAKEVKGFRR